MPILNKSKNTAAIFNRGREVVKVYDHGVLAWQKSTSIHDYLCFTALEAGQFTLTIPAAVTPTYLSYVEWSKDGRTWTHTDNTSEAVTIPVSVTQGEKVYWRGSGATMGPSYLESRRCKFSSEARFDVSGHIMSLLVGDNFGSFEHLTHVNTDGIRNATFSYLFKDCTTIVNAKDLVLPTFESYHQYIYIGLFHNCTSLVSQPSLPSSTLAIYCYASMYYNCTLLTESATLPAATLAAFCYRYMYYNCTNLETVNPILATTAAGTDCMNQMFRTCKKITRVELHLTGALTQSCCYQIFQGCSSLSYVKCLATDISTTDCLKNWLGGVSSTGTFIQAEGVEWPRGASGIPTGWVDVEKRTMPSGYKQLLQVTSDGTAYIQLGFGFEETDEVAATFSVDTSQTTDKYIVCPQTWNSNNNRYGMGVHGGGYYTGAFGNRSTGYTILTPRTSNDGELHNWTYAAATFAVTDKSCSINITGYTFGGITTNLRLFYGYNSNTKGAISFYKHIKGSTTACDFVAAIRESNDTAGLYDLANDEFVTCNGLTAGEEI